MMWTLDGYRIGLVSFIEFFFFFFSDLSGGLLYIVIRFVIN